VGQPEEVDDVTVFATALSGLFAAFFAVLAKRMTIGIAAAGAFIACSAAAFAVAKLALYALISGLAIIVPPGVVIGLTDFMPTHVTTYIGLILLAQTIVISYDYWTVNLKVAFELANAT
jgi:hypothetical protein